MGMMTSRAVVGQNSALRPASSFLLGAQFNAITLPGVMATDEACTFVASTAVLGAGPHVAWLVIVRATSSARIRRMSSFPETRIKKVQSPESSIAQGRCLLRYAIGKTREHHRRERVGRKKRKMTPVNDSKFGMGVDESF